jgi:UDP-N-acetylmuramate dehydrogenase
VPVANVPLAPLSTLGVGGEARWFARAHLLEEVEAVHSWCEERRVDLFVLGGGSNLVIADDGFPGLVLHIALCGLEFERQGEEMLVRAGAGECWDVIVAEAVSRGLAGVECLSGIPGSVGGTPIQNVGAYGQEVSDCIEAVTVFDRAAGSVKRFTAADCRFAYRTSRFRREDNNRFVILEVIFRLRAAPPTVRYPDVIAALEGHRSPAVSDVRAAVLAVRRRKGMVLDATDSDTRSVGSFFVNPVVSTAVHERLLRSEVSGTVVPSYPLPSGDVKIPAAWLIERSGFRKGDGAGRVGLSSKHPLALVNRGGATAREVLDLAARIKRSVVERFGIWLRPEPTFIGFTENRDLEYLNLCQEG